MKAKIYEVIEYYDGAEYDTNLIDKRKFYHKYEKALSEAMISANKHFKEEIGYYQNYYCNCYMYITRDKFRNETYIYFIRSDDIMYDKRYLIQEHEIEDAVLIEPVDSNEIEDF